MGVDLVGVTVLEGAGDEIVVRTQTRVPWQNLIVVSLVTSSFLPYLGLSVVCRWLRYPPPFHS